MLFLLLYFILCSVIVAMRCVIVSINHYLSIYLCWSSVATTVADCSRLPEQHMRKFVARVLIASGVVHIEHCCRTEVTIVN